MRRFVKAVFAGTAVLTLMAAPAAAQKAEVIHWWTSGGEFAAIQTFADMYEKEGGEWVDTAIAGGANARTAGINRIIGGDPPTAMQFNTGTQLDELVQQGMLRSLEDIAKEDNWRAILPQTLIDATTRNGEFYAVPVNVHGENWVYYNKPLFEEVGAPAPETWDAFFEAADKLKAAGKVPLALGGQPWQEFLMFRDVLMGIGGKDLYLKFFRDKDVEAVRSPEFRKVVDTFARLRDYVDEGSPGRNWNDATSMVMTGQAGMQIMGDWAKGEFTAAGKQADVDYGCVLGPGEQLFQVGGDVFVFPKSDDPAVTEAQNKLARLMISPEGQVAFNNKKGSVPVRSDVDNSGMDACAQKGLAVLSDPEKQVPSQNFLLSPDAAGLLQDQVSEFWNDPNMAPEAFIDEVVSILEGAA